MTSAETEKAALISELEERLNPSIAALTRLSGDVFALCDDRDGLITRHAYQRLLQCGLEPRYVPEVQWVSKQDLTIRDQNIMAAEEVVEEQMAGFLASFPYIEEEEKQTFTEEDGDLSARDRVLLCTIPTSVFNPLFRQAKAQSAALYQALLHHALPSGRPIRKRRRRRGKGKDKGESKARGDKSREKSDRGRKATIREINLQMPLPSWEQYSKQVVLAITKAVADGSTQSLLIAILLLLSVAKEYSQGLGITEAQALQKLTLPVAHIAGLLIDAISVPSDETSDADVDEGQERVVLTSNPFRPCLAFGSVETNRAVGDSSARDARSSPRSRISDSTATDIAASADDGLNADDVLSVMGQQSDAGSLVAEMGTETASMENDGEDLNEEDLLAQALALSLGTDASTALAKMIEAEAERQSQEAVKQSPAPPKAQSTAEQSTTANVVERFVAPEAGFGEPLSLLQHPSFAQFFEGASDVRKSGDSDVYERVTEVSLETIVCCLILNLSQSAMACEFSQWRMLRRGVHVATPQLPACISPHYLSFMLLEAALSLLSRIFATELGRPISEGIAAAQKGVNPAQDEAEASENLGGALAQYGQLDTRFTSAWCTLNILRVLRVNILYVVLNKIPTNSVGLGVIPDDDRSHSDAEPYVRRLEQAILNCVGSDVLADLHGLPCADILQEHYPHERKAVAAHLEGFACTTHQLLSSLRSGAIDAFLAGLTIFKPTMPERLQLLQSMLDHVPNTDYQAVETAELVAAWERNDPARLRQLWQRELLSRLCTRMASSDIMNTWVLQPAAFAGSTSTSANPSASTASERDRSIPRFPPTLQSASSIGRPQVLEHLRALVGMDSSSDLLSRMYEVVAELRPDAPQQTSTQEPVTESSVSAEEAFECAEFTKALLPTLLTRVAVLPSGGAQSHLTDAEIINQLDRYGHFLPSSHGEMSLLVQLQHKLATEYTSGASNSLLYFSSKKCHEGIEIVDSGHSAVQRGHKTWGTVVADRGFHPNTGVYEWYIRLDKCEKGHIFVGVATNDVATTSYVGGDAHGWGLIGTQALWHDRVKTRSDYGTSFGSGSVLRVRVDTDNHTLSFGTSGSDWGVAFDSLPSDKPVYPAVALYQREDRVTLLSLQELSSTSSNESNAISQVVESQQQFVEYGQKLLHTAEKLVVAASGLDDAAARTAATMHPVLCALLPSFAAALVMGSDAAQSPGYLTLNLLPQLVLLTKRFTLLHEMAASGDGVSAPVKLGQSIFSSITGDWVIRSAASEHVPSQEYMLRFDVQQQEQNESTESAVVEFQGDGVSGDADVRVTGITSSSRIKFLEVWAQGSRSMVEGRLSLDGGYFKGHYRDMKSGSSAAIEGMKVRNQCDVDPCERVLQVTTVLAASCGRLIGYLLTGMDVVLTDEPRQRAGTIESVQDSTLDGDTKEELEPAETKSAEREGEAPVAAEDDATADLKQPKRTIEYWCSSSFLAGGLPLDAMMRQQLERVIRVYVPQWRVEGIGHTNDTSTDANAWWWNHCFTDMNADLEDDTQELDDDEEATRTVLNDIRRGASSFDRLDKYVLDYVGQSFLMKVGGEAARVARRVALAALIKHSGCLPLVEQELEAINASPTVPDTRPREPLMHIWGAAQRVVEHAIRSKADTGLSYAMIAEMLSARANFLLRVQPNALCRAIEEQLEFDPDFKLHSSTSSTDLERLQSHDSSFEAGPQQQFDYGSRVRDAVDFLKSGPRDVAALEARMVMTTAKAMFRSAGLNSYLLLVRKSNDVRATRGATTLPPLTILAPLTAATEHVCRGFVGQAGFVGKAPRGDVQVSHYLTGLEGCGERYQGLVRDGFEAVYDHIAQLVQRSTWAAYHDGQCVGLMAWGLAIRPEDHVFLSKVQIFRVLQTVLDEARTEGEQVAPTTDDSAPNAETFRLELVRRAHQRLVQLALRIVHFLAAQVAFSKDKEPSSPAAAIQLTRMPSGPETLSRSLFEMLHAELYIAVKQLVSEIQGTDVKKPAASTRSKDPDDASSMFIDAEQYASRIVRLLHSVVTSSVCQKYVSTPRWLSLLLASVGFGGLAFQRRLLHLLMRLLVEIDPAEFQASSHAFTATGAAMFQDGSIFEDNDESDEALGVSIGGLDSAGRHATDKLLAMLLDAVALSIPLQQDAQDRAGSVIATRLLRHDRAAVTTIAAESLALLRVLLASERWREKINEYCSLALAECEQLTSSNLRQLCAIVDVYGGRIDVLRVGGLVHVRPSSLVNTSDSLAMQLAATVHTSGLVLAVDSSKRGVEAVLLEAAASTNERDETLPGLAVSGNTPIRPVRVSVDDVFPTADLVRIGTAVSADMASGLLELLETHALRWIKERFGVPVDELQDGEDEDEEAKDTEPADEETKGDHPENEGQHDRMLKLHLMTSTMRAVCQLVKHPAVVSHVGKAQRSLFDELLKLGGGNSSRGNLCVLEALEQRWAELWHAYARLTMGAQGRLSGSTSAMSLLTGKESLESDVESRSTPLEARSPLGLREPNSAGSGTGIALQFAGGLPFGLLSSGVDANAAVQQMMEMGFPREWCEVALRRCHYNIEMAINFCFEHSDDMNQMIQEDAAMLQAMQSARGAASYRRGIEVPRRNDRAVLARTLLEMGFPSHWCERALQATSNNVDAALTWILTNSDTLATEDERGSSGSAHTDGKEDEEDDPFISFNPLQIVSGNAAIDKALACTTPAGFPTVGTRDFAVREGKWYYEVVIHTGGCMQIGWVDLGYEGNADRGEGVGDCAHSWAYDGWRTYAWHGVFKEWGAKWRPGDVIGCFADLDARTLSFSLNGFNEEVGMGVAFQDVQFLGGLFPAASISKNERLQFNFGSKPFVHSPPEGYKPFSEHIVAMLKRQFGVDSSAAKNLSAAGLYANGLEEQRGLGAFVPSRRYFQPDEQPSSRRLAQLERSSQQQQSTRVEFGAVPTDLAAIEAELSNLTADLSTLYARLAAFRLLIHAPTVFGGGLLQNSQSSSEDDVDNQEPEAFAALLSLLRRCSQPNAKTRTYLNTVSLLLPSALPSIPSNLGSKLTVGAGPFLQTMRPAIAHIIDEAMRSSVHRHRVATAILAEVKTNVDLASLRGSSEWRQQKGLVPWQADASLTDDASGRENSNLIFAVWLTYVLMGSLKRNVEASAEIQSAMVLELLDVWIHALQSPFVALKLLAARMSSALLQSGGRRTQSSSAITQRLCSMVKYRIWQERASYPISSEYLQALCELVVTLGGEATLDGLPELNIPGVCQPPKFVEQAGDLQSPSYSVHPDELDGSIVASDGWQTWTGTITQHEVAWDKPSGPPSHGRGLGDKQDAPPALLPGRRVIRRGSGRQPRILRRTSGDRPNREAESEEATASSPPASSPPVASPPSPPPAPLLGTVTGIVDYEGQCFGGRTVEWDDGTTDVVNWGVNGVYDVIQVEVDKNGKIKTSYPPPTTPEMQLAQRGFGAPFTYGVVLRLRARSEVSALGVDVPNTSVDDDSEPCEVDGILELPDFQAKMYVRGQRWSNGAVTLKETQLLSGTRHAGWMVRFAAHEWQEGAQYEMSNPRSYSDSALGNENVLSGLVTHEATVRGEKIRIVSDIFLQREHLWLFDPNMKAAGVTLSRDFKSASADRSERCCVYGNVGFAGGVHYWEVKVEQADNGSLYIGVAEKDDVPGYGRPQRLNKWHGLGFVNYRAAFHLSSNERVYGEHFTAGDTIGVLLDLERGRISFFMDGMKYGEHILTDLGCAFDNLRSTSPPIRPRVFFPIVGFHKSGDRVTLTPKWLSSVEQSPTATLRNISRSVTLLSSWMPSQPATPASEGEGTQTVLTSSEKSTAMVAALPEWLYEEAWQDWQRWSLDRFKTVLTRAQRSVEVEVCISPIACAYACVRLGLSYPLFHGDRFVVKKSSGQTLEQREEGVILGEYDGKLWYRLDVQHTEGGSTEDASLAWCFSQDQVEAVELTRANPAVPAEIRAIPLPKIPAFRGGSLHVTYEAGAVLRDGLEIDTSAALDTVPGGTVVVAEERRVNSSNVARHLVTYNGQRGWISERIRGGNEELMVAHVTSTPAHEAESSARASEAQTAHQAVKAWVAAALRSSDAATSFLQDRRCSVELSRETFDRVVRTLDGEKAWTIEADMLLGEWMSACSDKAGTEPANVSADDLAVSLQLLPEHSGLYGIAPQSILARASLLRVTNRYLARALPYIQVQSFHRLWQHDKFGYASVIDALSSVSPDVKAADMANKFDHDPELVDNSEMLEDWEPITVADRVQRLRRLIFEQTKRAFWHDILQATTTHTALPQDEYEDPRDIRTIKINRVKAAPPRLAAMPNPNDRLRNSVFGQLHREMRSWPNSAFRRAYLGKGHGGQRRAFKVKFLGEGVNDYGGPYRAVFEQVTDEAQSDTLYLGSKASQRCLLPLLIPCPNRVGGVGTNQDKFLLSPCAESPLSQELMQFFGRLVGTACRHGLYLALDLSSMLWRPLGGLPVTMAHLDSVDCHAARALAAVEEQGLELERSGSRDTPAEWADLTFTTYLSDGTRVPLIPGGEGVPVTTENWRSYVHLAQQVRLRESTVMLNDFKAGLATAVPVELFHLFTARELETLFTGSRNVDVDLLRQCTEYEEVGPTDAHIESFWEVMEEMSAEERTEFLRFVWARSRMPSSIQDMPMNFKIQAPQGAARETPDEYLPHAQTCFFTLSLPAYSSKQILKEKLLYAIKNSPNMDADVRLHSAEGWTDA